MMNDNVYIIGVGMTKFGKYLEKSIKMLTGEALKLAFSDCGLEPSDIEAAFFSNSFWGMYTMQHCIRGQVALSANGIDGIPITNVENACGGGSSALHIAWTAVKAGLYDCVLVIGAEKIYDKDRSKMMLSFATGSDFEQLDQTIATFNAVLKKLKKVESEKKTHSVAMDMYAVGARFYMEHYGITQKQLAIIAAKAHNNSVMNPHAQYTFPMTVEEVINDREVAFPLTRAMCAPVGDGAAAAIICSEKFLKKRSAKRAVRIRASVLRSGSRESEGEPDIGPRAAKAAYEMANLGPEDINIAEVHDATAFGELVVLEELGFCGKGEGGIISERGDTALDGRIPVNTGGGLIARGHPVGASGIAQIYELVTQLRGEAGKRQVKDPKIAIAENGGGLLGTGAAVMCLHILEGLS